MKITHIVLDQNYLRDREAINSIAERAFNDCMRLLLVDRSFFESAATVDPILSTTKNLEYLVAHRDLVDVGRGYGELIQEEVSTRKPTTDFIDKKVTAELHALLDAMDKKDAEKTMIVFNRIHLIGTQAKSNRDAQSGREKRQLVKMIEALVNDLDEVDKKALSTDPEKAIPALLGHINAMKTCAIILKNLFGLSDSEAASFVTGDAVCVRHFDAFLTLALDWFHYRGASNADIKKIENDFLDLDYVIAASYLGILMSKDKKPNRILRYLRSGLNERVCTLENVVNLSVEKNR